LNLHTIQLGYSSLAASENVPRVETSSLTDLLTISDTGWQTPVTRPNTDWIGTSRQAKSHAHGHDSLESSGRPRLDMSSKVPPPSSSPGCATAARRRHVDTRPRIGEDADRRRREGRSLHRRPRCSRVDETGWMASRMCVRIARLKRGLECTHGHWLVSFLGIYTMVFGMLALLALDSTPRRQDVGDITEYAQHSSAKTS
jgi:hypothetical protein